MYIYDVTELTDFIYFGYIHALKDYIPTDLGTLYDDHYFQYHVMPMFECNKILFLPVAPLS